MGAQLFSQINSIPPPNLSPHDVQFLRIMCLAVFGASFFVAIGTFKGFAGFSFTKPIGLWVIYILWPLVCTVIYIISQLILVFRTLDDRWPIGDIVFGTAFFTIAQVLLFAFSITICDSIKHYIDGLFFFTLCMLLSVMMVYKYWDSITVSLKFSTCRILNLKLFSPSQREDLEFSVGSKASVWEVKDPLLAGGAPGGMDYSEEDTASNYHGGPPASLVGGLSGQQLYQKGGYGRGYPPSSERY
jgi:Chitin synthase export chaperone